MRTIPIALLAGLLLLVPAFRVVETLPAQISDGAFWQTVTESSEPSGTFLSENFVSNERGFQYVIPPLLQTVQPGGAYIGVGPEQNFTYVAAFHPKIAFIIDIRRQNMIEQLLYKAIFEQASSRPEFLSLLFSRKIPAGVTAASPVSDMFQAFAAALPDSEFHRENLQAAKDLLWKQHRFALTAEDEATLDHVYDEIAKAGTQLGYTVTDPAMMRRLLSVRILDLTTGITGTTTVLPSDAGVPGIPGPVNTLPAYSDLMTATDANGMNWSYLASEENYRSVREMQQKNLIIPLVGDFAGPSAIRAVGKYLKDHDSMVSVFYLSNVEEYLTPLATLKRFYDNVATLPLNSSRSFIRSAQATGVQPGIVQSLSSPMLDILNAVIEGRAQSSRDILRMSH